MNDRSTWFSAAMLRSRVRYWCSLSPAGSFERPPEADRGGNDFVDQRIERADADGLEHRRQIALARADVPRLEGVRRVNGS